jgi:hypothetical protein
LCHCAIFNFVNHSFYIIIFSCSDNLRKEYLKKQQLADHQELTRLFVRHALGGSWRTNKINGYDTFMSYDHSKQSLPFAYPSESYDTDSVDKDAQEWDTENLKHIGSVLSDNPFNVVFQQSVLQEYQVIEKERNMKLAVVDDDCDGGDNELQEKDDSKRAGEQTLASKLSKLRGKMFERDTCQNFKDYRLELGLNSLSSTPTELDVHADNAGIIPMWQSNSVANSDAPVKTMKKDKKPPVSNCNSDEHSEIRVRVEKMTDKEVEANFNDLCPFATEISLVPIRKQYIRALIKDAEKKVARTKKVEKKKKKNKKEKEKEKKKTPAFEDNTSPAAPAPVPDSALVPFWIEAPNTFCIPLVVEQTTAACNDQVAVFTSEKNFKLATNNNFLTFSGPKVAINSEHMNTVYIPGHGQCCLLTLLFFVRLSPPDSTFKKSGETNLNLKDKTIRAELIILVEYLKKQHPECNKLTSLLGHLHKEVDNHMVPHDEWPTSSHFRTWAKTLKLKIYFFSRDGSTCQFLADQWLEMISSPKSPCADVYSSIELQNIKQESDHYVAACHLGHFAPVSFKGDFYKVLPFVAKQFSDLWQAAKPINTNGQLTIISDEEEDEKEDKGERVAEGEREVATRPDDSASDSKAEDTSASAESKKRPEIGIKLLLLLLLLLFIIIMAFIIIITCANRKQYLNIFHECDLYIISNTVY